MAKKQAANFDLETAKWLISQGLRQERDGGSESGGVRPSSVDPYRVRLGKASVEGGGSYDVPTYFEDNEWPLELGIVGSDGAWIGSGRWITAINLGSGFLRSAEFPIRLECIGKSWTFTRDAGGVLQGTTQEAIAAAATGTVSVEVFGNLELENWSSQNVATGKKCKVCFNVYADAWQIVSVDC